LQWPSGGEVDIELDAEPTPSKSPNGVRALFNRLKKPEVPEQKRA
jgi:hypothetical protein